MVLFIDANVLIAFANASDVHHARAVRIVEKIHDGDFGEGITTDYIFDEVVSVLMRKLNKKESVVFGQHMLDSEITFLPIDSFVFDEAWNSFKKYDLLSFTDSSSLAFMQLYGIRKIATFDKAFQKIVGIEVVDTL